jgi:hypothetical protein
MYKKWGYMRVFMWFLSSTVLFSNIEANKVTKNKANRTYRIIIANLPEDFFGEVQAIHRIAKAAKNLGWDCKIVDEYSKHPESVNEFKPDLVISLHQEVKPFKGTVPHFLYVHHALNVYLDKQKKLNTKLFSNFLSYDGFIEVTPNIDPIRKAFVEKYKQHFYSVKSVFSVPSRQFNSSPKQRLIYWGSTWDKARREYYKPFYDLLDHTGYLDIYGPSWSWDKMGLKSYRGLLPMDDHTVVDKISEAGIALILHSHVHLKGGVPTSRIFEAAAASAVIICDHHPFVQKEFGDSVLYIDPNQAPQVVFKQIDSHVKWVQSNPDKALALARRSHGIFMERFILENELKKIAELYERMVK